MKFKFQEPTLSTILLLCLIFLGACKPSVTPASPEKMIVTELPKTNANLSVNQPFGKASLSTAEKKALRKYLIRDEKGAYEKGIICLKHCLSRSEIVELIGPGSYYLQSTNTITQGTYIHYSIGADQLLTFSFDKNGNLTGAEMVGTRLQLPSLESFSTNTTPREQPQP